MGSVACEEPDTAYDQLLICPSGLGRNQVTVDFSNAYDRVPHPDEALESSVYQTWNKVLSNQPYLFNALKFRYGGTSVLERKEERKGNVEGCGKGRERKGIPWRVCIRLGLTDYGSFVGTQLGSAWRSFLCTAPERLDPDRDHVLRCRHMAANIGNAAIVETSDEKVLVLARGERVGEFPGRIVYPGGHSEPSVVGISGHDEQKGGKPEEKEGCTKVKQQQQEEEEQEMEKTGESRRKEGSKLTKRQRRNEDIAREMFDGIIREVVEETGVPEEFLSDPLLLGISCRRVNVRLAAFFFVGCSLTAAQALECYKTAVDGYESTGLRALTREELWNVGKNMPGDHAGGTELYKIMIASRHSARSESE
ncbi:hypothetical protein CBR_g415 [Chara braunii]|uniref:Nudix hydrolase domain-containing protein n=1 Tax=Chara braunii TaxID=69332 RepID=A0A388JQK0_CHABU|nr:hypothetical protein CBR_g415 [Chara braunii]|eukprot:GBG60084.1 hypothetical protein CBR_g415 [Chara braunii]